MSVALGAALLLAGCGSDDPTGPEFGDLVFAPESLIQIGADRQVDLELFNVSNEAIGPITFGAGSTPRSVPLEFTCIGLEVLIAPGQVSSIPAGGSVEISVNFSFAGLTEDECPFATWEVDINAALGALVLAAAQVRMERTELE
jgi:hypothetical protein